MQPTQSKFIDRSQPAKVVEPIIRPDMDYDARIERIRNMPDGPMKDRMLKFAEARALMQPTKSQLISYANEDIQKAVIAGELDGDSDANEIRQVLASYPVEIREHFDRDLNRDHVGSHYWLEPWDMPEDTPSLEDRGIELGSYGA